MDEMNEKKRIFGEYSPALWPMIDTFFDFLENSKKVLSVLRLGAKGISFRGYPCGFQFAHEFDPEEQPPEEKFETGALFFYGPSGVIVDYPTYYKYLNMVVQNSIQRDPSIKESAEGYMKDIQQFYGLEDIDVNKVEDTILEEIDMGHY